jgi:ERF superfamily
MSKATTAKAPQAELIEAEALVPTSTDPAALIARALSANANIETIEKLVALEERVAARRAREAWHSALAAFQAECPMIPKSREAKIPLRSGGSFSYTFAALQDVMRVVKPYMAKHGLTSRWGQSKIDATSATVVCLIAHRLGHVEDSGPVTVPVSVGDEGRGMSAAQRASSAMTYAKRMSIVNGLGVTAEDDEDDDATDTGDPTKPTAPDRPFVVESVSRAADRANLSVEERLDLTKRYLKGQPLNKAALDDLRQLQMFLGDAEGVAQWRADRERDVERGKP